MDQAAVTPAPSLVAPSEVMNPPTRNAVVNRAMDSGVGGPRGIVSLGVVRLVGVEVAMAGTVFVRVVG